MLHFFFAVPSPSAGGVSTPELSVRRVANPSGAALPKRLARRAPKSALLAGMLWRGAFFCGKELPELLPAPLLPV